MNIIAEIGAAFGIRQRERAATYQELIQSGVDDKPVDQQAALALLDSLGKSAKDLAGDVKAVRKLREKQTLHKSRHSIEAALEKLNGERDAVNASYEKAREKLDADHRSAVAVLTSRSVELNRQLLISKEAAGELLRTHHRAEELAELRRGLHARQQDIQRAGKDVLGAKAGVAAAERNLAAFPRQQSKVDELEFARKVLVNRQNRLDELQQQQREHAAKIERIEREILGD